MICQNVLSFQDPSPIMQNDQTSIHSFLNLCQIWIYRDCKIIQKCFRISKNLLIFHRWLSVFCLNTIVHTNCFGSTNINFSFIDTHPFPNVKIFKFPTCKFSKIILLESSGFLRFLKAIWYFQKSRDHGHVRFRFLI